MLISRLFFVACVKKIEQTGKITFDANKHWSGSEALFNDEISDELFVQCVSVEQEDEDRDFQIEFEVLDEIAEIFDKYRAKKSIVVSAYNLSSSSSITFNNADNLSASLGNSRVVFYNNSSIDDEQKMIEMLDEINKATIFLQMKYSAL